MYEEELLKELTIDDIPPNYRLLAEMIGVKKLFEVCKMFQGDNIYLPKAVTLLRSVRNRKIIEESTGYNEKEMAKKYDLTSVQIKNILKVKNAGRK